MGQRIQRPQKSEKVHPQHGKAGQRRRNDDGESHHRKSVDRAIHQEFLSDEPERAREAGARQPHGRGS